MQFQGYLKKVSKTFRGGGDLVFRGGTDHFQLFQGGGDTLFFDRGGLSNLFNQRWGQGDIDKNTPKKCENDFLGGFNLIFAQF